MSLDVIVTPEANGFRNEASLSMIFNLLKRMESRIEHVEHLSVLRQNSRPTPDFNDPSSSDVQIIHQIDTNRSLLSAPSPSSPQSSRLQRLDHSVTGRASDRPCLSFSAHRTIFWPEVQASMPPSVISAIEQLPDGFPARLETDRTPFLSSAAIHGVGAPANWLGSLSLSTVKELSNAYFDSFNRIFPFIDRDYYFLNTLGTVLREGFNFDIESCLVLNVMALGCMSARAFKDGGFEANQATTLTERVRGIIDEDVPGCTFFEEARQRIGYCLCEKDFQSTQYYLTSAVFYSQIMRPIDEWMMTSRACFNCATFWRCSTKDSQDEWMADMQSRLFWTTTLIETVISQEMELPPNQLEELEDTVPLPRFIQFPQVGSRQRSGTHQDDSYYHYHFLAQIAHRIILTRIRHEMFYANPSSSLADELRHQIEQWKENLPPALRDTENDPKIRTSPAAAVAVSLLETRYRAAIYHLGRPFLFKALNDPESATERDLKMCSEALQHATDWKLSMETLRKMKNFMPFKYFAGAQYFGQLLLFHAIRNTTDARLRSVLPESSDTWCSHAMQYIGELAPLNDTMSKDYELLSMLFDAIGV